MGKNYKECPKYKECTTKECNFIYLLNQYKGENLEIIECPDKSETYKHDKKEIDLILKSQNAIIGVEVKNIIIYEEKSFEENETLFIDLVCEEIKDPKILRNYIIKFTIKKKIRDEYIEEIKQYLNYIKVDKSKTFNKKYIDIEIIHNNHKCLSGSIDKELEITGRLLECDGFNFISSPQYKDSEKNKFILKKLSRQDQEIIRLMNEKINSDVEAFNEYNEKIDEKIFLFIVKFSKIIEEAIYGTQCNNVDKLKLGILELLNENFGKINRPNNIKIVLAIDFSSKDNKIPILYDI